MTAHKFRRPDSDRHTYAELSKRISYNPKTGELERIGFDVMGNRGRTRKVGSVKTTGYMRVKIEGIDYLYHHVVFCLCKKRWPIELDHIDRNKLNNRIENLRECTRKENQSWRAKPVVRSDGMVFDTMSDAGRVCSKSGNRNGANIYRAIKRGVEAYGYRWQFQ